MTILLHGLKGEPVKRLQEKLGVKADGIFGAETEKAVKDYQQKKGLKVDGIAGPDTFASLGLNELILLKRGSRGDTVKKLQEKLGIKADGIYGTGTAKAVKEYQEKNGLKADGVAGPVTLAEMSLMGITQATVRASLTPLGKSVWDTIQETTEGAVSKVKSALGI
jgi:peptidoglycan hydrolase-like protein with peptidoglycan-binding domain